MCLVFPYARRALRLYEALPIDAVESLLVLTEAMGKLPQNDVSLRVRQGDAGAA